jgi:hypothetical protein
MPNPEILNVAKACEIETNITLSTIQNQEEQESELLRNDQVKDKKFFGFLIKLDLIHVLSLLASESFVITD